MKTDTATEHEQSTLWQHCHRKLCMLQLYWNELPEHDTLEDQVVTNLFCNSNKQTQIAYLATSYVWWTNILYVCFMCSKNTSI